MIRRHLIIVFLYYIITFSYAQVGLFKNNSVDSVFLHSLLDKRVVIIGELHHLEENVNFQAQVIKFLHENGYRFLLEGNMPLIFMMNQYIKQPQLSFLSSSRFDNDTISYNKFVFEKLRKINYVGKIEFFDIGIGAYLYEWGWYIINHRSDFTELLSLEEIDSLYDYFYENEKVSINEYWSIVYKFYLNANKQIDKSGVLLDYFEALDEALKLNNSFKNNSKKYLAHRELKIIELLEKKYFPQDDTSKYVIVTGRSHAWLNGVEDIKSTFSEYLVKKLGRENVGIIISTYPRREYLSNKVKKYLGVNNDVWYNLKQLKKNLYIVKPNPDVDYLLILNE